MKIYRLRLRLRLRSKLPTPADSDSVSDYDSAAPLITLVRGGIVEEHESVLLLLGM